MTQAIPVFRLCQPIPFYNSRTGENEVYYEVLAQSFTPYTDADIRQYEQQNNKQGLVVQEAFEYI